MDCESDHVMRCHFFVYTAHSPVGTHVMCIIYMCDSSFERLAWANGLKYLLSSSEQAINGEQAETADIPLSARRLEESESWSDL